MRKIHYNNNIYCLIILGFILGVHNGHLALWKENSEIPYKIYSTPVSNLPIKDQHALAEGIHIKNEEALTKILEDYLS